MSQYTIKNYFFKCANSDAAWILLLGKNIRYYSFIGVYSNKYVSIKTLPLLPLGRYSTLIIPIFGSIRM